MANSTVSLSDDKHTYQLMKFWLDGIITIALGSLAILINSLAIWILVRQQKMQSMFLHILTCSLVFDNGFILMQVLIALFYDFKLSGLVWLLPHFAFPLKEVFYTCNILCTISLSYERYAHISDTEGYKQSMKISKFRHTRLKKYIFAIVMFSMIFNLPEFFTFCVSLETYRPSTTVVYKNNQTIWKILDMTVKWTISLIGSFSLLVFFNWKIFKNVKEKMKMRKEIRKMSNISAPDMTSVSVPDEATLNVNEKDNSPDKIQSPMKILKTLRRREKFTIALFALVASFFLCNVWFFGEVIADCIRLKVDANIAFETYEVVTRVMRVLNSCTNVLIYCVVDRTFKTFLKQDLKRIIYYISCTLIKHFEPVDEPDCSRATVTSQQISSTYSTKET